MRKATLLKLVCEKETDAFSHTAISNLLDESLSLGMEDPNDKIWTVL